jgi:hypothetical protein
LLSEEGCCAWSVRGRNNKKNARKMDMNVGRMCLDYR